MNVQNTVKKAAKPAIKFGAATVGLTAGTIIAGKMPELGFLMNIPVVGKYLAKLAPGAAVMFIAYMLNSRVKNELVKAGAFGMGLAGFANAFKRVTSEIPMLAQVSNAIPAGLGYGGHTSNTGQYPPDFYLNSGRAYTRIPQKSVNGLGSAAYSLEGSSNAFKLEGLGSAAYSLEGR